jgi:hypothetical protein
MDIYMAIDHLEGLVNEPSTAPGIWALVGVIHAFLVAKSPSQILQTR